MKPEVWKDSHTKLWIGNRPGYGFRSWEIEQRSFRRFRSAVQWATRYESSIGTPGGQHERG